MTNNRIVYVSADNSEWIVFKRDNSASVQVMAQSH